MIFISEKKNYGDKCLFLYFKNIFKIFKKIYYYFYFKLIFFLVFSNNFDMLKSKIIFKK
jgi:hypothetical protein